MARLSTRLSRLVGTSRWRLPVQALPALHPWLTRSLEGRTKADVNPAGEASEGGGCGFGPSEALGPPASLDPVGALRYWVSQDTP